MKAGRVLVALLVGVGLFGVVVSGAPLYSRFLYLGILLTAFAWGWTHWTARRVKLTRHARELRANVGDVFEENFRLFNNGRLPILWMEVFNQSTMPLAAGSRLFTLVPGREQRTYLARTWLTRRGGFPLGPTHITIGDPFGLFTTRKTFPAEETLVVFPAIQRIEAFPFPPGLLPGGQAVRRKSHDITPHASGVREYVHGDAMKRIHWRTTVRRGQLMVKEFEQDPQAEIWLYLDLQMLVHHEKPYRHEEMPLDAMLFMKRPEFKLPPSTLEYAVSITASLAHHFIRRRFSVGYAGAGQTHIIHPAERSERQEAKILETLAFVEADGRLSVAALVSAQVSQLRQGSSVILVTPTTRPDLLNAVDDLQLRHLRPVIILLEAETFGGPRGTERLVASLRERRVPVYIIPCDADLPQALSQIPTTFKPQDTFSWQAPVLSR
jgi:uncharacterized protein (DUF58 family)